MEFAVDCLIFRIHKLESVRSIAIHEAVAIRKATIREQEHGLMG